MHPVIKKYYENMEDKGAKEAVLKLLKKTGKSVYVIGDKYHTEIILADDVPVGEFEIVRKIPEEEILVIRYELDKSVSVGNASSLPIIIHENEMKKYGIKI